MMSKSDQSSAGRSIRALEPITIAARISGRVFAQATNLSSSCFIEALIRFRLTYTVRRITVELTRRRESKHLRRTRQVTKYAPAARVQRFVMPRSQKLERRFEI